MVILGTEQHFSITRKPMIVETEWKNVLTFEIV